MQKCTLDYTMMSHTTNCSGLADKRANQQNATRARALSHVHARLLVRLPDKEHAKTQANVCGKQKKIRQRTLCMCRRCQHHVRYTSGMNRTILIVLCFLLAASLSSFVFCKECDNSTTQSHHQRLRDAALQACALFFSSHDLFLL